MQNDAEQAFEAWRDGAVVIDDRGEAPNIRPAAFVFVIPGGLAWVEPSYSDPMGATSQAFHEAHGMVEMIGLGFLVTAPGRTVHFLPYEPVEDTDLVGDAVDWWRKYIADGPLSLEEERARVRELCGLAQSSP